MEQITASVKQEIHKLIKNRVIKAPDLIKKGFGFKYNNQNIIIEEIKDTLFVGLLSSAAIKDMNWRQKKGMVKFPGLITHLPDSGIFGLINNVNFLVSDLTIRDGNAFTVGPSGSAIMENLSIEFNTKNFGVIRYTIELGFILRPPAENSLYSLIEAFDDMVVFYVKNAREAANNVDTL